ncbi:MAG: hypothetical protein JNM89_06765 [Hyphomicrobiaceae bacterium]|nr:hypothetical protein [Hyphomicrobiaceae bacterium]
MNFLERVLVKFDDQPWAAVWRILLGVAIPPVFSAVAGGNGSVGLYLALFIALLMALRVAPALLRFTLPLSPDVKEVWRKRRFIAKDHDSYQWQKLFWMGLGIFSHAAVGSGLGLAGYTLAAICLVGGGAGLVNWIRINDARPVKVNA